jgi:hypothetical protein
MVQSSTSAGVILVYVLKIFMLYENDQTCDHGLVVLPDCFCEIGLGSSLLPVKARFILSLSSFQNDLLENFYFFNIFYCVFFTSKKYGLIFL